MSGSTQTKSVVLVIVIAVMGMLGLGLLPLKAAGALKCESVLKGADPKERFTEGYLVNREEQACDAKSGSRLSMMVVVGVLYLTVGLGAVLLPLSNFERVAFAGEDPEDVYESN